MRPERLLLAAFGAYAGEQVIDFAELGRHRLFLIHGPTGSGKTTLLDAICYALFGESSGDERGAGDLRSHHAAATQPTAVEFDFALGAERFRIRRQPAQTIAGRGGRPATRQAEVTLWRRGPDGVLAVLAEKQRPVEERLKALLGYTAAEFRQVVLLPQGRFRELLVADRGARREILATLFRTAFYRRIEEALVEMERGAREAARGAEARRAALLGETGAATIDAGSEQLARFSEEADAAGKAAEAAARSATEAERRLAQAREDARRITDAHAARLSLAAIEAGIPEDEARRAELAAAQRAAALAADAARLEEAEAAAEAASRAVVEEQARLAAAERRRVAAEAALADAPSREAQASAAAAEATRLEALAEQAAKLAQSREALAAADAALRTARETARRAEKAQSSAAEASRTALAARDAARALAERVEDRRAALAHAEGRARDAAELASAQSEVARLEADLATAKAAHVRAEAARAAARAERAAADRDAAALLAATLEPGSPCPVCGSRDHPAPAHAAPGAPADAAAARAREEEAEEEERNAYATMSRLAGALAGAVAARDALAARIATASVEAAAPESARSALAEAERAAASLPALEEAAVAAALAERSEANLAQQAAEALRIAGERFAAAEATVAALLGTMPEDARDPARLASRIAAMKQRAEHLRAAIAADRDRVVAARAEEAAAREAVAKAEERAQAAAAEAARRADALLEACHSAGFDDIAAWRAALREDAEAAALAEAIRDFGERLATARAKAVEAERAAAGLTMPDLEAIEAEASRQRHAAQEAERQHGMARQRAEAAAALLDRLREADRAFAEAQARHGRVAALAELTAGKNRLRLSFEGFVLASLLDEALAAANAHLARMLAGRFRLARREEPERANAAIGLDIEVLDEWTGQARPAGTLSGGEGFCAALALALGLSETVQAHAGARRIDTLLIDEGFGTLDEAALDTAMDVLAGLEAGNRLVGVISHVAELRTRIPAQLEVRPGLRGSTARFVVA